MYSQTQAGSAQPHHTRAHPIVEAHSEGPNLARVEGRREPWVGRSERPNHASGTVRRPARRSSRVTPAPTNRVRTNRSTSALSSAATRACSAARCPPAVPRAGRGRIRGQGPPPRASPTVGADGEPRDHTAIGHEDLGDPGHRSSAATAAIATHHGGPVGRSRTRTRPRFEAPPAHRRRTTAALADPFDGPAHRATENLASQTSWPCSADGGRAPSPSVPPTSSPVWCRGNASAARSLSAIPAFVMSWASCAGRAGVGARPERAVEAVARRSPPATHGHERVAGPAERGIHTVDHPTTVAGPDHNGRTGGGCVPVDSGARAGHRRRAGRPDGLRHRHGQAGLGGRGCRFGNDRAAGDVVVAGMMPPPVPTVRATARRRWCRAGGGPSPGLAAPSWSSASDGRLVGLDPATGAELWTSSQALPSPGTPIGGLPSVLTGGRQNVYLDTSVTGPPGAVVAVDAAERATRWTWTPSGCQGGPTMACIGGPWYPTEAGLVYIMDTNAGTVVALDPASGAERWRSRRHRTTERDLGIRLGCGGHLDRTPAADLRHPYVPRQVSYRPSTRRPVSSAGRCRSRAFPRPQPATSSSSSPSLVCHSSRRPARPRRSRRASKPSKRQPAGRSGTRDGFRTRRR